QCEQQPQEESGRVHRARRSGVVANLRIRGDFRRYADHGHTSLSTRSAQRLTVCGEPGWVPGEGAERAETTAQTRRTANTSGWNVPRSAGRRPRMPCGPPREVAGASPDGWGFRRPWRSGEAYWKTPRV